MKTVMHRKKPLVGYQVSEDGTIIGPRGKALTPAGKKGRHGNITDYSCRFYFPEGYYPDYSFQKKSSGKETKTIPVHRVVMETYKPIDKFPPDELKDTWDNVPEQWKQWVRETAVIDHIDDNPANNDVTNLKWTTNLGNSNFRKERESK